MAAARKALAVKQPEKRFILKMLPDVDKAVDRLLVRIENGERKGLGAEFEALLQQYPDYHMTNYGMGVYVGVGQGGPVAAIPFFEKAVRIFPPLPEAHLNLGNAYIKAARIAEAVGALRKAIRYSDRDEHLTGLAHDRLSDLEKIIRENTPFDSLNDYIENQKLFDAAFEHLSQQHYARAIELFKQVLEQNPKHTQSYGNMALAQARLGHKAAALASLDKALELDPHYEPARINRKAIETMTEGEPHVPVAVAETEYYRDMLESEKSGAGPWWKKLKFFKPE
jgi:tetratricopeptide (TPR) repeat protein